MTTPNPTTSKRSLHQHERASPVEAAARMRLVAEGRRLLAEVTSLPWRTAATDDTCVVDADNEEVCALAGNYCSHDEWPQMEARAALIVFAVNNLPALLRTASENVSLREQVVSANEQRDAAVREARDETNRRHSSLMSRAAGALEKMQLYATEYPKDSHVLEAKEVAQMLRAEARATLAQPAADGGKA